MGSESESAGIPGGFLAIRPTKSKSRSYPLQNARNGVRLLVAGGCRGKVARKGLREEFCYFCCHVLPRDFAGVKRFSVHTEPPSGIAT